MFIAAIGHHYSFSIEPYLDTECSPKSWKEALYAFLDFSDVSADIKEHLGIVGKYSFKPMNSNLLFIHF